MRCMWKKWRISGWKRGGKNVHKWGKPGFGGAYYHPGGPVIHNLGAAGQTSLRFVDNDGAVICLWERDIAPIPKYLLQLCFLSKWTRPLRAGTIERGLAKVSCRANSGFPPANIESRL